MKARSSSRAKATHDPAAPAAAGEVSLRPRPTSRQHVGEIDPDLVAELDAAGGMRHLRENFRIVENSVVPPGTITRFEATVLPHGHLPVLVATPETWFEIDMALFAADVRRRIASAFTWYGGSWPYGDTPGTVPPAVP